MRAAWAVAAARRMSRGGRPLARAMADTPAPRPPPPRPRPGAPRVVVLAGPTAVGKTAVSVALAKQLGGEIVNADSVAVYRDLDVGSAKPTPSERGGVPHHLLDVLDPGEDCSAGSFYSAARTAIEDILARDRVPIVVGGTGLYLRWLVHGRPATLASDADTTAAARAAVDAAVAAAEEKAGRKLADAERWAAASSALAAAGDPVSAARVGAEPNNEYRLLRALEVVLATGAPREVALVRNVGGGDSGCPDTLDYDFRAFFLHADRVATYRRIDARAEAMLASGGLLRETAAMLASGLRTDASCALRAIGYRHAAEAIENAAARADATRAAGTPPPPPTPTDGVALWSGVAAASRRLAHSQYTWFRGDPLYRWVDVKGETPNAVAATIKKLVDAPSHDPGPPAAGRLTPAQESALKRYMPELTVLAADDALARVAGDVVAAADALPPSARAAAVAAGAARAAKLEEQRVMTVAAEAVKRQARQALRGEGRRDG